MKEALKYIYGVLVLGLLVGANFLLCLTVSEAYQIRHGLADVFEGVAVSIEAQRGMVRIK